MKWNAYGHTYLGTSPGSAAAGKLSTNVDFYLMDEEHGIYIVCDAIQDMNAKQKISEVCARAIREVVVQGKEYLNVYRTDKSLKNRSIIAGLLQKGVQSAHQKALTLFQSGDSTGKALTTLECLLLLDDYAIITHIGDSRVYLSREGVLHLLTKDHRDDGKFLTRALGALPSVQADTLQVELNAGDVFFLCSSSVSDHLSVEDLITQLEHEPSAVPLQVEKTLKSKGSTELSTYLVLQSEREVKSDPGVMSVVKKTEIMKKISIFRFMTYQEITKVLSCAQVRNFRKGEVLLEEGARSDEMFIIADGTVEVVKGDVLITKRGAGDVFGEMGLFENVPRSASIRASKDGCALTLKRSELLILLRQDSPICVKLLWALNSELNQRLRKATTDQAAQVASGNTFTEDNEVVEMNEVPFSFDGQ